MYIIFLYIYGKCLFVYELLLNFFVESYVKFDLKKNKNVIVREIWNIWKI